MLPPREHSWHPRPAQRRPGVPDPRWRLYRRSTRPTPRRRRLCDVCAFSRRARPCHRRRLGCPRAAGGAGGGGRGGPPRPPPPPPPHPLPPPPMPFIAPPLVRPGLARGVVRYVGEPVAAVVTEDRYSGEDVAELVGMDYEPLPVVVDPLEAASDTTVLHPEHGSNTALAFELGSIDGLFDGCEVVVTQQMTNQRVAPAPLEVRSSACAWGKDGRLTFWASTQSPHGARDTIATALSLDPANVHFIAPDVGGGFGAKFGVSIEDLLLAVLAQRLGRPMRWTETRTENMLSMGHGRAQLQTVTIGGRRDGTV